jgi:hypothetical protein
MASETLEHDGVEIAPFERLRSQRDHARIRIMCRAPLLPGVQSAAERANSASLARPRRDVRMRARDHVASGRWICIERKSGEKLREEEQRWDHWNSELRTQNSELRIAVFCVLRSKF